MELILLPLLLLAGLLTTLDGGSDGGDVSGAGDDDDRLEGSGNDQIAGGTGDDLLTLSENAVGFGGEGDDTLNASDDATAYGRAGDDSLTGSDNATIMGGDGNDSLTGSDAASLWGGAGDDTLLHSGDGQVHAGAGNDEVTLTGLGAVVYGGDGDDSFLVTNGAAEVGAAIYGGAGVDTYIADHAANGGATIYLPDWDASDQLGIVLGTDDLSRFRFSVHPGSADGSDGTDGDITEVRLTETLADGATASTSFWLRGTYGYDVRNITLYGEDTDDELDGRAIFGDNDLIEASGSETVRGGIGNDDLTLTEQSTGLGGVGNDTLEAFDDATGYGLAGNDQLVGWDNATIMGGDGNDLLSGADDARAWGGAGDDRLFVYGDAVAYGGAGDDRLFTNGDAVAYGDAGDDWLRGAGNAVLDGGTGEDTLIAANPPSGDFQTEATGGAGSDLFVIGDVRFGATTGDQIYTSTPMVITDFDPAQDQLGIVADPRILSGLEIVQSYSAPLGVTTVQLRDTSDYNTVAAFTLQGQHQIDPSDIAFFSDHNLTPIDFDFTGTAGNDSFTGPGHPAGTSVATGGAGDDSLRLDQGAVYGGAGDDTLTGQDTLDGGAGDDLIQLRTSEVQSQPRFVGEAYGGDGNDTLEAWEENAFTSNGLVLDGGAGDDLIRINQSGAVTAGGGDDTIITTLRGGTITLGAGQDTLAIDVDDERGTTTLTDFDPATDELSILVPQADRAATSISLSTDATSGFVSLQITTGDTVQTLVLQGITSGVSLSSVRLYADEAALMAGTSYATA